MATAYIGIGSNIGNKAENCAEAIRQLQASPHVDMISASSLYATRPVGGPPHQGDFLNGVLKIETKLSPEDLLGLFKGIEKGMGREEAPKDHPRIIDLDILMYDNRVFSQDDIEVPHPRMHERGFVLRGLAEIAPDTVHPVTGKTARQLFEEVKSRNT